MTQPLPSLPQIAELYNLELPPPNLASPILKRLQTLESHQFAISAQVLARLLRLSTLYSPEGRFKLGKVVERLFRARDWEGAHAELCALDFFCFPQHRRCLAHLGAPEIDHDIPAARTYALECGQKVSNADFYFEDRAFYSDVKALQDNHEEMLERIYKEIWKAGIQPFIWCTFPADISTEWLENQRNRKEIIKVLTVASRTKPSHVKVMLHRGEDELLVDFTFNWKRTVMVSEGGFDPFLYAEECHSIVFRHAKKLVRDKAFLLTYVKSRLYNTKFDDFDRQNETFYRAFARRVFIQYNKDRRPFREFYNRFHGDQTVAEVLRSISGILFLEDDSDWCSELKTPASLDYTDVQGFLYLNPNAIHEFIYADQVIGCRCDDFRYDNY